MILQDTSSQEIPRAFIIIEDVFTDNTPWTRYAYLNQHLNQTFTRVAHA